MLDPKYLRSDIQQTAEKLARRGYQLDVEGFVQLEEKRKSLQIKTQGLEST
jgi:seryl-tRNA synthetase